MVTRERYSSQLCAGFKIKRKPTPLFFTYSGEGRGMAFKKLKYPLDNWKPAHMSVSTAQKKRFVKQMTFAESSWTGFHDRWKRLLQSRERSAHPFWE